MVLSSPEFVGFLITQRPAGGSTIVSVGSASSIRSSTGSGRHDRAAASGPLGDQEPDDSGAGKHHRARENSLGFRGPELPADLDDRLSILTVGGSTTECFYVSEGKTWSDLLARRLEGRLDRVWLNNAGLDGHSSFGHRVLLSSEAVVRLHPKVVVFLVGCNDVARDDFLEFGVAATSAPPSLFSLKGMVRRLAQYSEVVHIGSLCYQRLRMETGGNRVLPTATGRSPRLPRRR